jgi:hypothetical protein
LLALLMLVLAIGRRLQANVQHKLLHPRHVREIAAAVEHVSARYSDSPNPRAQETGATELQTASTSLGIRISAGEIPGRDGFVKHYAFSCPSAAMTEETARALADLILRLKHPEESNRLVKGEREVFHLLVKARKLRGSLAS